jgi:hypothetical protein
VGAINSMQGQLATLGKVDICKRPLSPLRKVSIRYSLIVVVSSNMLTCGLSELITVLQQLPESFVPKILSLNRKSHPSSCFNWPLLHSTF